MDRVTTSVALTDIQRDRLQDQIRGQFLIAWNSLVEEKKVPQLANYQDVIEFATQRLMADTTDISVVDEDDYRIYLTRSMIIWYRQYDTFERVAAVFKKATDVELRMAQKSNESLMKRIEKGAAPISQYNDGGKSKALATLNERHENEVRNLNRIIREANEEHKRTVAGLQQEIRQLGLEPQRIQTRMQAIIDKRRGEHAAEIEKLQEQLNQALAGATTPAESETIIIEADQEYVQRVGDFNEELELYRGIVQQIVEALNCQTALPENQTSDIDVEEILQTLEYYSNISTPDDEILDTLEYYSNLPIPTKNTEEKRVESQEDKVQVEELLFENVPVPQIEFEPLDEDLASQSIYCRLDFTRILDHPKVKLLSPGRINVLNHSLIELTKRYLTDPLTKYKDSIQKLYIEEKFDLLGLFFLLQDIPDLEMIGLLTNTNYKTLKQDRYQLLRALFGDSVNITAFNYAKSWVELSFHGKLLNLRSHDLKLLSTIMEHRKKRVFQMKDVAAELEMSTSNIYLKLSELREDFQIDPSIKNEYIPEIVLSILQVES